MHKPSPAARPRLRAALAAAATGLALAVVPPVPAARAQTAPPPAAQSAPRWTPSAQDRADLARIETYLNSLTTLEARFLQVSSNGAVASGRLWMQRPGRMRFEYDPPSPILLVADGTFVIYHDKQLKQTSHIPLGSTPLGILLAERVRLEGTVTVLGLQRGAGELRVTLARAGETGAGTLTLVLSDSPLQLRQWSVVDAQGQEVRVTLQDARSGGRFDPGLFRFVIIPGEERRDN